MSKGFRIVNFKKAKPIFEVENLSKSFDGRPILKKINMKLFRGEIVGLLGPNGSGKSTLYSTIIGEIGIDQGKIYLDGVDTKDKLLTNIISYCPQFIYIFDTIVNRPLNDPYLKAIEDSTLYYIHIGSNSLDICLEIVQEYKLDVAIDLMGYTDDKNVCKLFSKRIASVQMNYLGYPGTTGSKQLHDYIIADKIVIPQHHEQYYEEDVVRLPDCYLCSDNTNAIADLNNLDTQKPCPLDKAGFIFCCFNNIWKITSKEFDIWMRLLKKNPGSILWLRSDLETAIQNLKLEAKARKIDPDRLIFAEKTDIAEHLARHQQADLFLDTFAYNAHATALDALWAGLPLLTMRGDSFPSRVGASILSAAELPELITTSEHEYESKAQWLVDHPDELRQLKDRLIKNRLRCSLFNTEKTTRDLEQIYRECWQETTGMISK